MPKFAQAVTLEKEQKADFEISPSTTVNEVHIIVVIIFGPAVYYHYITEKGKCQVKFKFTTLGLILGDTKLHEIWGINVRK